MKHSIRFIAMLFGCFAISFFFSSCNWKAKFAKTGQMISGPINITDFHTSDGSLTLKDNNNNNASWVSVSKNQVIKWNVTSKASASHVEIVEIASASKYHSNNPNFFSTPPQQAGNSQHWQATVDSPDPNQGVIFEVYYIKWKLKGEPTIYTFDPLLQLNP